MYFSKNFKSRQWKYKDCKNWTADERLDRMRIVLGQGCPISDFSAVKIFEVDTYRESSSVEVDFEKVDAEVRVKIFSRIPYIEILL